MVHLSTWVDLWDQSLGLVKHNESGIEVHQRLYKFLLEFGKLQTETFAAQRKLCNKYVIDNEKIFGMDNSYGDAFNEFLRTVHHAVDAESLISTAFGIQAEKDVKLSVKEEKVKFKQWKEDRNKLFHEMKTQMRIIDDEIKRYRDKYRDMVKANDEYTRIDADRSTSRVDVDKALLSANQKKLDYERARDDYSAALNQFNIYRSDYFNRVLPNWSHVGYELAAGRYNRTQQLLSALYERIKVASERMELAARELQETCSSQFLLEKDTMAMVEKLRSGYPPPGDITFVDLSTPTAAGAYSVGPPRVGGNNGYGTAWSRSQSLSTASNPDSDELSGRIYASANLCLPADFHGSVSAADAANIEAAGLPPPATVEASAYASPESVIYAALVGNASLALTPAAATGTAGTSAAGGQSQTYRKPTLHNPIFGGGGGGGVSGVRSNLLQRFFSRRMKHNSLYPATEGLSENFGPFESNLPWRRSTQRKLTLRRMSSSRQPSGNTDQSGVDLRVARSVNDLTTNTRHSVEDLTANMPSHHTIAAGLPLTRQSAEDSSDFSDSSLYPDDNEAAKQSAYAQTNVLVGLPETDSGLKRFGRENGPSNNVLPASQGLTVRGNNQPSSQPTQTTTAPLARPESPYRNSQGAATTEKVTNGRPLIKHPPPIGSIGEGSAENNNRHDSSSSSSLTGLSQRSDYAVNNRGNRKLCAPPRPAMSPTKKTSIGDKVTVEQLGRQKPLVTSTSAGQRAGSSPNELPLVNQSGTQPPAEEGIPRHFFPRQTKVRTSSTTDTAIVVGNCTALYSFTADGFDSCYFPFETGDTFHILAPSPTEDTTDWLRVLHCQSYKQGYVPTAYVDQHRFSQPQIMPIPSAGGDTSKAGSELSRCPASPSSYSQVSSREYIRKKIPASRMGNLSSPLHRFPTGGLTQDTEL